MSMSVFNVLPLPGGQNAYRLSLQAVPEDKRDVGIVFSSA
jgi:hypothetical protein